MARIALTVRIAAPLILLAGCVPSTSEPPVTAPRSQAPAAGLDGVLGATARALTDRFGPADLDVREGSAQKLQFGSQFCVLDAYLYPRSAGGEAVVTHLDARLPDGRDVDRASCIAALSRRPQAR